jgi:superfamily II DNA or RNA helicase
MAKVDYLNSKIIINVNEINDLRLKSKLGLYLRTISITLNALLTIDNEDYQLDINQKTNFIIFQKIRDWFLNNNLASELSETFNNALIHEMKRTSSFKEKFELVKSFKNLEMNLFDNEEFLKYKDFCDKTLKIKLLEFQYLASFFMTLTDGAFDFSVPGSGKTIISYSYYNYLEKNNLINKTLIIGPINSKYAWRDEHITCFNEEPDFMDLSDLSISKVDNYFKQSSGNTKKITFINYEKIKSVKESILLFIKNNNILLIIDEAHRVKNPGAKVTDSILYFSEAIKFKILLTGTPMPNGHEDLYSITKIFKSNFPILNKNYGELAKIKNLESKSAIEKDLFNQIRPFFSRISKKTLINQGKLLKPNHFYINTIMTIEQRAIYDFLEGLKVDLNSSLDDYLLMNFAKALLIRKMQASSNPALLNESLSKWLNDYSHYASASSYLENDKIQEEVSKILEADNKLMEIIDNSDIKKLIKSFKNNELSVSKNDSAIKLAIRLIDSGEKVIIWDTFVKNIDTLAYQLKKNGFYSFGIIYGATSYEDRNQILNSFKYKDLKLLIANPSTLAESVSLHKACQKAIYLNRNYNAAQFIQSKDRIHRINMPIGKTADYYYFLNENSIDGKINKRLQEKEINMLNTLDSEEISIGGELDESSILSVMDILDAFEK